jgi:hypothetical protein
MSNSVICINCVKDSWCLKVPQALNWPLKQAISHLLKGWLFALLVQWNIYGNKKSRGMCRHTLSLVKDQTCTPELPQSLAKLHRRILDATASADEAEVDWVWNVKAHAQKDFVFRRNGRVHLNRRELQFSLLLAAEVCASAVVMLDTRSDVVWRVLATHYIRQFPLYFPSRASPCAITFQLDYTAYIGRFISSKFFALLLPRPLTTWHLTCLTYLSSHLIILTVLAASGDELELSEVLSVCLLLYVQSWAPDDGRKERPKYVECFTRVNAASGDELELSEVFSVCLLLYVQSWAPDDGRKERPKYVVFYKSK